MNICQLLRLESLDFRIVPTICSQRFTFCEKNESFFLLINYFDFYYLSTLIELSISFLISPSLIVCKIGECFSCSTFLAFRHHLATIAKRRVSGPFSNVEIKQKINLIKEITWWVMRQMLNHLNRLGVEINQRNCLSQCQFFVMVRTSVSNIWIFWNI